VLSRHEIVIGRWKKALQLVSHKPKRTLSNSSVADVVLKVLRVIKEREESINAAATLAVAAATHRRTMRRSSGGFNRTFSAVAPSSIHVDVPIAEVDESPNPVAGPATGPQGEAHIEQVEVVVVSSRSERNTPDYSVFPESSC
jgi:hypothetical protein